MNNAPHRWFRRPRWRWLFVAAALIALAVYGYRFFQERTRLARLQEEYTAAVKLQERFEQQVQLADYETPTVRELIRDFEKATGIEVSWSEEGYEMQRWLERPLGCTLPPLAAHEWLDAVAGLRGFQWDASEDGKVVLNAGSIDVPRYWLNYPLPITPAVDGEELHDLLASNVEPDSWEDVGGPWAIQATPAGLMTFQSVRGHFRTQQFLAGLNKACKTAADRAPLLGIDPAAGEPICLDADQQTFRELQRALETPITLRVVDMPYVEFIERLKDQAKFPNIAHPLQLFKTLGGSEVPRHQPVTCNLQQVPLHQVLRQWKPGDDLRFGLAARGQLLVVVDDNDLRQELSCRAEVLCAYPVADLTRGDYDPLIELITSTLSPDTWQDVGGPGAIGAVSYADVLLISQPVEVHTQIQELLTQLRKVRSGESRHVKLAPRDLWFGHKVRSPLPQIAELQQRLEKPTNVEYQGTQDTTAWGRLFRFGLGNVALVTEHNSPQHNLWCHLPERPLRENLELFAAACDVDRRDLEQVVDSRYVDDSAQACDIFDLRPWMVTRKTSLSVVDLITAVVDGDAWQDVGGAGSCQEFDGALVVNVHPRTMQRVRLFLSTLEEYTTTGRQQWRGKKLAGEALNQPLDLYGPTEDEAVRQKWFAEQNAVVREQLKQPVTVKFSNKPRAEALYAVALKHQLPLFVRAMTFGPTTQHLVPCNSDDPLTITSHDLVSIDVQDQPLGKVLQELIGDPAEQQIVVHEGSVQIGKTGEALDVPPIEILFCVDDLIQPRGPYLPKQFMRTLESEVLKDRQKRGNSDPNLNFQFCYGNLLAHDAVVERPEQIGQILRELRSGQRKALPVEVGDSSLGYPQYPPGSFRPFVGSPLPVIPEVE